MLNEILAESEVRTLILLIALSLLSKDCFEKYGLTKVDSAIRVRSVTPFSVVTKDSDERPTCEAAYDGFPKAYIQPVDSDSMLEIKAHQDFNV